MENRVAHRLITVAAAVVDHLECERGTRAQELAVQIAGVLAVRRMQPLVRVLMMDVREFASGVQDAKDDVVVEIAVIDVRWVVGKVRCRGLAALQRRRNRRGAIGGVAIQCALRQRFRLRIRRTVRRIRSRIRRIGRHIDDHGRIADCPRGKEELFEFALHAVRLTRSRRAGRRAEIQTIGQDLRADAAGPIVDRELVLARPESQVPLIHRRRVGIVVVRKCLHRFEHFVIVDRKFAEGLGAIRLGGDRVEFRLSVVDEVSLVRPRNDCGKVGVIGHRLCTCVDGAIRTARRLRDHRQDRLAGEVRIGGGITRQVVDQWRSTLTARLRHLGEIVVRDLTAVNLRAGRLHGHRSE